MIRIEVCDYVDDALVEAFSTLIPQLSTSSAPPDADVLTSIVGGEATTLLLALDDDDRIVGSLTLAVFTIPTGVRAWIEDVVVDDAARGHGVGASLNQRAVELAAELGAKTVDLTSRPSRDAANRMYKRLGFEARETNVYRYSQ